jgi:hypothetical protein
MSKNPYIQQCSISDREQAFADLEIAICMAHEDGDELTMGEVFYFLKDISDYIFNEEILHILGDRRIYKKWKETPESFINDFHNS